MYNIIPIELKKIMPYRAQISVRLTKRRNAMLSHVRFEHPVQSLKKELDDRNHDIGLIVF